MEQEIEKAREIGENLRKNLIIIANELLYIVEMPSGKLERPSGGDWVELLVSRGQEFGVEIDEEDLISLNADEEDFYDDLSYLSQ